MKKISIETTKVKARATAARPGTAAPRNGAAAKPKAAAMTMMRATIGLDLGDRTSRYCELNAAGEVVKEASVAMTRVAMTELFAKRLPCRVALEVGTNSRWVSRVIASLIGHENRARSDRGQRAAVEVDHREHAQRRQDGRADVGQVGARRCGFVAAEPAAFQERRESADGVTVDPGARGAGENAHQDRERNARHGDRFR